MFHTAVLLWRQTPRLLHTGSRNQRYISIQYGLHFYSSLAQTTPRGDRAGSVPNDTDSVHPETSREGAPATQHSAATWPALYSWTATSQDKSTWILNHSCQERWVTYALAPEWTQSWTGATVHEVSETVIKSVTAALPTGLKVNAHEFYVCI